MGVEKSHYSFSLHPCLENLILNNMVVTPRVSLGRTPKTTASTSTSEMC